MNVFNSVFIASILGPIFISAGTSRDPADYKRIGKLALGCSPNDAPWPDPSSPSCNTCSCVSDGVVICTTMACLDKKLEGNPEPENEPEPGAELELEGETEPSSDSQMLKVYKQLRDDATGCTPGQAVDTDPCAGCKCILPGVMQCSSASCLFPVKKLAGVCHGFGCYKPPGRK